MFNRFLIPLVFFVVLINQLGFANIDSARQALSSDAKLASKAIGRLRAMGPLGLDLLFNTHTATIERYLQGADDVETKRLIYALDQVAQQRDSYAAQLYWCTELDAAKSAARKEKKPILSLHLLGKLSEEFSCANSRLFRAVLYANTEISAYLRSNYILHWQSVRPVPQVTIDYGDGRTLRTTLTGNSIHYVLMADGQVIDALPGLYTPRAFTSFLSEALALHGALSKQNHDLREQTLRQHHRVYADSTTNQFANLIRLSGLVSNSEPHAEDAAVLTASKLRIETPLLRKLRSSAEKRAAELLERAATLDIAAWQKLASKVEATLDANSLALISRQLSSSPIDKIHFERIVQNLQKDLALDTVRNDYLLRIKLRRWLADGETHDLTRLNERVYAELFLTPSSDPWLGLYLTDTFDGLTRSRFH